MSGKKTTVSLQAFAAGPLLWTSGGERIMLGRELGRGGEGAVYEVDGKPDHVAKIYLSKISGDRVAKLGAMTGMAAASPKLLSFPSRRGMERRREGPAVFAGRPWTALRDRGRWRTLLSASGRRAACPAWSTDAGAALIRAGSRSGAGSAATACCPGADDSERGRRPRYPGPTAVPVGFGGRRDRRRRGAPVSGSRGLRRRHRRRRRHRGPVDRAPSAGHHHR